MNAQQLRDLAQKAYGKQKMASEKSTETPAVLDFNTQSQGLSLEGAQCQAATQRVECTPIQQKTRLPHWHST